MKVLHVLDQLNRGGAENLVFEICRNIQNSDFEVMLLASNGGQMEDDFKKLSTPLIFIKRKLPIDIFYISKLKKIIKKNQIDILHTHSTVSAMQAHFAVKGTKSKHVFTLHGFDYESDWKNRMALKYIINRTDANLYVSGFEKQYYVEKFRLKKNNNFVIYNGISAQTKPSNGNLRKELGIENDAVIISMIGNFYFNGRDQLTVCKALPEIIRKQKKTYCLFIGGRSNDRPYLYDDCVKFCNENNIDNNVIFLGIRDDVRSLLAELDIFVFSSNIDTFGIAIIEAMREGLPVVLNDYPPFMEISDNGKYARIFKTKDSDDLAEKLIDLIENPDKRKKLGQESKQWADNNFDISINIARSKELYEKLLNN